jgi:hypothetical protein
VQPQEKRTFTYTEASALVEVVQRLTELANAEVAPVPEESPQAAAILARWVAQVTALGAEVKGRWLVDFDNGSGYYCWRWPEQGLRYFHSYQDGLRGRMPIQ